MARRCWKHSRQKTGRPCVGRKGTVVSLPHCEQLVLVSERTGEDPPPPPPSARLALQALQRLGSFLKPLSAKNICSPPVKTNSAPHSAHFKTRSWYSIAAIPLTEPRARDGALAHRAKGDGYTSSPREPGWVPRAIGRKVAYNYPNVLPDRGLILGSAAPSRETKGRLIRFAPL